MLIWELWKRRKSLKHEGKGVSVHKMIVNIKRHLKKLLKVRKPALNFRGDYPAIMHQFRQLKPTIKVIGVMWEFLKSGWVKYNPDRVSRGNPGRSSWAFCLRDEKGDLVYAAGEAI
ncbi:hypothetical protein FXO38_13428 [Capsicum annuum]|nr:hypothetical protein FXO38_13428 [Capsicum annuum]